jgi:hypothetical protein
MAIKFFQDFIAGVSGGFLFCRKFLAELYNEEIRWFVIHLSTFDFGRFGAKRWHLSGVIITRQFELVQIFQSHGPFKNFA